MTIEGFLTLLYSSAPYFLIKGIALVLLFLHLSFSVVVVRQAKLMTAVVEANISPVIYTVAIVHLLFSLFVFISAEG